MDPIDGTNLTELVKYVAAQDKVEVVSLGADPCVLSVPVGRKLESAKAIYDQFRLTPERRKGTAVAMTLASFIDMTKRGQDSDSVIFAFHTAGQKIQKASLTAVLNYNQPTATSPAGARFGDHRVSYEFPHSDEWLKWMGKNATGMSQREFAAFLEDRLLDIVDSTGIASDSELARIANELKTSYATPSDMLNIAADLEIQSTNKVASAVRLQNGDMKMTYESSSTTSSGGKVIEVPALFLIGIPVFDRGVVYRLPVRLRYRPVEGAVMWFYEIYRWEQAFDHAFEESCGKAQTDTGLTLFHGKPE